MVNLTVNLTPPLTGVKGEMWVMFVVGGVESWYYVMDIPPSVNGVIGPFGYTDPYTINVHQIRFPEQTINGVTYKETQTGGFMITQDWTFNITLTPKEAPSPEIPIGTAYIALAPIIAGLAMIYLFGR